MNIATVSLDNQYQMITNLPQFKQELFAMLKFVTQRPKNNLRITNGNVSDFIANIESATNQAMYSNPYQVVPSDFETKQTLQLDLDAFQQIITTYKDTIAKIEEISKNNSVWSFWWITIVSLLNPLADDNNFPLEAIIFAADIPDERRIELLLYYFS